MQKSIGKSRLFLKVRRLAQQVFQRMSRWQRLECGDEISDLLIGSPDTDSSAELLQQIDAGPSVRCIHHEMHRSVRFEHAAQSSESCIWVSKMMENPGAHNLIEARSKILHL